MRKDIMLENNSDSLNSKDNIDPFLWVKYLKSKGIKVDYTPVCVLEYHFYNSNT